MIFCIKADDFMGKSTDGKIKIGVIGPGDVFQKRFLPQLAKQDKFELCSVVDVLPESEKMPIIENALGATNIRYHQICPYDQTPQQFFEGLDVVYISSPNEFHVYQTLDSLGNGLFTITEKPLLRNKSDLRVLRSSGIKIDEHYSRLFCQDHHILKPVTMCSFDRFPELIKQYGPITHAKVTFFEEGNLQGLPREKWLISPEAGGGVFIDIGVHMAGIVTKAMGGEFADCNDVRLFDMYPNYNFRCETGFYGNFIVRGDYFAPSTGSNVEMKIAKGVNSVKGGISSRTPNHEVKVIELNLSDADLLLNYMRLGAEHEYVGKKIRKPFGSGLEYADSRGKINCKEEVEPGFYLIKDGFCRNLMDKEVQNPKDEYSRLLCMVQESLETGSPFLSFDDAERALNAVFMAYDKSGGVTNMQLERTYGHIRDFIYA